MAERLLLLSVRMRWLEGVINSATTGVAPEFFDQVVAILKDRELRDRVWAQLDKWRAEEDTDSLWEDSPVDIAYYMQEHEPRLDDHVEDIAIHVASWQWRKVKNA